MTDVAPTPSPLISCFGPITAAGAADKKPPTHATCPLEAVLQLEG